MQNEKQAKPNNVVVVGAGRMGRCHANKIKEIEGLKISGVYDPVKDRTDCFCKDFEVEKVYASLAALAVDKDVDGVLVCNYTDQHFETVAELIRAGVKNIFCEKALVRKIEDGETLLALAEKAGTNLMVGHHRRYDRGYIELKRMVDAGELGTVRMAKVHLCHPGYNRQWGDFFTDFGRSGGVILDMMSHLFDQLNWYFGKASSVSGSSLMLDESQPLPVDYVSGTVIYDNSIICGIDGSWQRYGEGCDKIEIYGDEACVVYNGKDCIDIYGPQKHTTHQIGESPAYLDQMKAFGDMIEKGTKPVNSLCAGLESARVSLKMIEAVESVQTISF